MPGFSYTWRMVDYQLLQSPYTDALMDELQALGAPVFGELDGVEVAWRLTELPCSTVFVARAGALLVGFKLGYAVARKRYHSWLGAVHPEWRRQGIALALMERQHRWLLEHGYTAVETATAPSNQAMLNLNLRVGFRVIGTYCRDDGKQRITLAKSLSA